MIVITCSLQLSLGGVGSLKEKRRIVKSIVTRLQNEFHISVAEVDHLDVWQTAGLGLAAVGNDAAYLHGLMEKAVQWVTYHRPDLYLVNYKIEYR